MIQRCTNPKNKDFPNWGGRGISVSESWLSFESFFNDMGPRPGPEYSIDRRDNDRGYSPENCSWQDRKSQARNKRSNHLVEIRGVSMCIAEASELPSAAAYDTIWKRLKSGWDIERAVFQKSRQQSKKSAPAPAPPATDAA